MGDEREKLLAEAEALQLAPGDATDYGDPYRRMIYRLVAALRAVPPVETVNTVEELDALPVETVVRGADGDVCVLMYVKFSDQSTDIRWRSPGWEGVFTAPDIALPARVLFRPDTEGSG